MPYPRWLIAVVVYFAYKLSKMNGSFKKVGCFEKWCCDSEMQVTMFDIVQCTPNCSLGVVTDFIGFNWSIIYFSAFELPWRRIIGDRPMHMIVDAGKISSKTLEKMMKFEWKNRVSMVYWLFIVVFVGFFFVQDFSLQKCLNYFWIQTTRHCGFLPCVEPPCAFDVEIHIGYRNRLVA